MAQQVELLPYAVCTVSDVKAELAAIPGGSLGPDADDLIRTYINAWTENLENASWGTHRTLAQVVDGSQAVDWRVEYFDGGTVKNGGKEYIQVAAPPFLIDTASDEEPQPPFLEIWQDGDRTFDATTQLTMWDGFYVEGDGSQGIICKRYGCWTPGVKNIKVRYKGGLIKPSYKEGETTIDAIVPPLMRKESAFYLAMFLRNKRQAGQEAVSFPGGGAVSLSMGDPTKFPMSVRRMIERYRVYRGRPA